MRRITAMAAAIVSLAVPRPAMSQHASAHAAVVPAGTTFMVRLLGPLSTKTHHAGARLRYSR